MAPFYRLMFIFNFVTVAVAPGFAFLCLSAEQDGGAGGEIPADEKDFESLSKQQTV